MGENISYTLSGSVSLRICRSDHLRGSPIIIRYGR